jgi:Putative zinc-finger
MIFWRCSRLRPGLVDFAAGILAEPSRARIERHLSTCARCAEAVVDLREVPGEIRRLAPAEPSEEFWAHQRRAILDTIDGQPLAVKRAAAAWPPRSLLWGTPVALAASVAVALFASHWGTPTVGAPQAASRTAVRAATTVAHVESATSQPASWYEISTLNDNALFPEDTSLLGLADQLDDESGEVPENDLI